MSEKERARMEEELAAAERELIERKKQVTELRRRMPREELRDYTLKNQAGEEVKLSSLFGDKKELIVVHNMGKSCVYCTMWADGFNGILHHLMNRAAFVVVSPDDPATQREFAESRGWKFNMLSAADSGFTGDMGFTGDDGSPWPGVSTFEKTSDGRMLRAARTFFGPGDDFCSTWHLFDLLPMGVNGWEPKYKY